MSVPNRPWMADVEIKIMDSLFKTQQPKRVLEWGAGGSTLYWPPKYDFIEAWVAVELDKAFARELRTCVADKVTVKGATGERYWKQRGEYDMIIVDGHHRPECLTAALELLAENGIVVLHDSGRAGYNVAWELYPNALTLYPGEMPIADRYYKHRGITAFWKDEGVRTRGWCWDYAGQVELPERPAYEALGVVAQEVEAEGDGYLSDPALASLLAGELGVEEEELPQGIEDIGLPEVIGVVEEDADELHDSAEGDFRWTEHSLRMP